METICEYYDVSASNVFTKLFIMNNLLDNNMYMTAAGTTMTTDNPHNNLKTFWQPYQDYNGNPLTNKAGYS